MRIQLIGKKGYIVTSEKRDPVVAIQTGDLGNKVFTGGCTWGNRYGEMSTANILLREGWGDGRSERGIVSAVKRLLLENDMLFMTEEGKYRGVDLSDYTPKFIPWLNWYEKSTNLLKHFKKSEGVFENTSSRRHITKWVDAGGKIVLTGEEYIWDLDGGYWHMCILQGVNNLVHRCESCGSFVSDRGRVLTEPCEAECREIYIPECLAGMKKDVKEAFPCRVF